MARYIDADDLIKALQADFDREGEQAYEMAKLGVADASVKYSHGQFCFLNAIERVKDTPTADVAPKSEVEQLQHKYDLAVAEREANVKGFAEELSKAKSEVERLQEDVERLQEINNRQVENIRLAKSEVAREIFEEIDRMIFGTIIPNDCAIISIAKLAELKKKYTEGKK